MDLLKRSELPAWLMQRFASARGLADALNTTRQTAHNLITGRTIPSYETCQKLGLEPMFLEIQKEMPVATPSNLDDFLSQRSERAGMVEAERAIAHLLDERGPGIWSELQEATRSRASSVGSVDGKPFEWSPHPPTHPSLPPSLLLDNVVASFSSGASFNGSPRRFSIVFGRNPSRPSSENPPSKEVWNLELSVLGGEVLWDLGANGIVGARAKQVADQIIRHLIEYRDKCEGFYLHKV